MNRVILSTSGLDFLNNDVQPKASSNGLLCCSSIKNQRPATMHLAFQVLVIWFRDQCMDGRSWFLMQMMALATPFFSQDNRVLIVFDLYNEGTWRGRRSLYLARLNAFFNIGFVCLRLRGLYYSLRLRIVESGEWRVESGEWREWMTRWESEAPWREFPIILNWDFIFIKSWRSVWVYYH